MNTLKPIFPFFIALTSACLSFPDAGSGGDAALLDARTNTDAAIAPVDSNSGDGAPLQGNVIVGDVSNTTLTNGNLEIHFSAENGFLIDSWMFRNTVSSPNLVFTDDINEKFAGVHSWSLSSFQWRNSDVMITELARGEAVYRFRIEATDDRLTTSSYYTIFPDGRIHRDEEAQLAELGSLAAYLALQPGQFDRVNSSYGSGEAGFNIPTGVDHIQTLPGAQRGWACAISSTGQYEIGLAHDISSALPPSNQARITVSGGNGNGLLSLIFDWAAVGNNDNDAASGTSHTGNFIMAGGAGVDCSTISSYHDWLLDRPATVDLGENSALLIGGASDDDSDGYYEGGGFWAIQSTNGTSLAFTVNTSNANRPQRPAFRLHDLVLAQGDTPIVTVDDIVQVRGQDFLWQVEGTGQGQLHWIYFGKPLNNGDVVQVSAPTM